MNVGAVHWAMTRSVGDARAKFLLAIIASGVNGQGTCRMSLYKLVDRSEIPFQQLMRRLHHLEERGLLVKRPSPKYTTEQRMYDFRLRGEDG